MAHKIKSPSPVRRRPDNLAHAGQATQREDSQEPTGQQDGALTPSWRDYLEVHPAANLFPLMSGSELRDLADDIERNGLQEKIKLHCDGATAIRYIIDGRNRIHSLERMGCELFNEHGDPDTDYFEYVGRDPGFDPYAYVISANIQRRHLDAGQRALIVLELRSHLAAAAKQRQEAAGERGAEGGRGHQRNPRANTSPRVSNSGKVNDQLAKVADVSPATVKMAHKVATERPDLADKVRTGRMKLNAAYKIVKPSKVVATETLAFDLHNVPLPPKLDLPGQPVAPADPLEAAAAECLHAEDHIIVLRGQVVQAVIDAGKAFARARSLFDSDAVFGMWCDHTLNVDANRVKTLIHFATKADDADFIIANMDDIILERDVDDESPAADADVEHNREPK